MYVCCVYVHMRVVCVYVCINIHIYTSYIINFQLLLSNTVVLSLQHIFFSFFPSRAHVSVRVRAAHRCFERAGMYGDPGSHDYFDNLYRFAVSMSTR